MKKEYEYKTFYLCVILILTCFLLSLVSHVSEINKIEYSAPENVRGVNNHLNKYYYG